VEQEFDAMCDKLPRKAIRKGNMLPFQYARRIARASWMKDLKMEE
jgi:hypothetical protein